MTIIHTIAAYALAPNHTYVAGSYTILDPAAFAVRLMTSVVYDILVARYPLPSSLDDDYDCEDEDYAAGQLWTDAGYYAEDLVGYGMTPDEVRELGFDAIAMIDWARSNEATVEAVSSCVDNPISVVRF